MKLKIVWEMWYDEKLMPNPDPQWKRKGKILCRKMDILTLPKSSVVFRFEKKGAMFDLPSPVGWKLIPEEDA
jgi:hypothetical protein